MIDIFFDYFGYDKEHLFVAGIAYECVIICRLVPLIITINRNNIIVLRGGLWFFDGLNGFLVENLVWDLLYLRGDPPSQGTPGVRLS